MRRVLIISLILTVFLVIISASDFDKRVFNKIGFAASMAPQIITVTPQTISLTGGNEVVITGENFTADTKVFFGNQTIINPTITPAEIRFIAPPQQIPGAITLSLFNENSLAQTELRAIPKSLVELESGQLTTLIGGQPSIGDGGPAINAQLGNFSDVVVDSNGNIFITDTLNHRVRRIDARTGVINTIAGNGLPGFSGDEGPAIVASLNKPSALAVDSNNNIILIDERNLRIRKIDAATGIITTIAGDGLYGCFSSGCFVVGNNDLATKASTAAYRLVIDSKNNIFLIEDGISNCLRRIDSSTGIINGFLGGCPRELDNSCGRIADIEDELPTCFNPLDIAMDNDDSIIIYNAKLNRVERRSTIGDPTQIQVLHRFFNDPDITSVHRVVPDRAGNIFVATFDGKIFKLNSQANSREFIAFVGDKPSLAVDKDSNLIIGSPFFNQILKVAAGANAPVVIAGNLQAGTPIEQSINNARLSLIAGITLDKEGNIYYSDGDAQLVRQVNLQTGLVTTIAGNNTRGFGGDNGPATSARLNSPEDLAVDAAGNVYIADLENRRIRRVDAITNIITTIAGNGAFPDSTINDDGSLAVNVPLEDLFRIELDRNGNLLILDTFRERVRQIDLTTGIIKTIVGGRFNPDSNGDGGPAINAFLREPIDITVDKANNLFISQFDFNSGSTIRRVDANTKIITTVAGGGTNRDDNTIPALTAFLGQTERLASDNNGNILIGDASGFRVRRLDVANGTISTILGNGDRGYSGDGTSVFNSQLFSFSPIFSQFDIAVDPTGNLIIADVTNRAIRVLKSGSNSDFGLFLKGERIRANILQVIKQLGKNKSKQEFTIGINRLGNFNSKIIINIAQSLPAGVKVVPISANDFEATFKVVVTKDICGDIPLLLTGQDQLGRTRRYEVIFSVVGGECKR